MLLSVRFLTDVQNVNSWEEVSAVEIYSGDAQTIYFRLIDASLDRSNQGYSPAGRRYMAPATSTLSVTLVNIDDAKQVVRSATQPFSQDPSIWSIPILASDPIVGSVAMNFVLTQPGPVVLNARFAPGVLLRVK